jgi:hypothetical protein
MFVSFKNILCRILQAASGADFQRRMSTIAVPQEERFGEKEGERELLENLVSISVNVSVRVSTLLIAVMVK